MNDFNVSLVVVGGLVLALGLISGLLKRRSISEPLVFLVTGILLGPVAFGVLRPNEWGDQRTILQEAARVTIAIGLMAAALRVPKEFPPANWRPLAVLLALGMPFMWLISSLLIFLILGLPPWLALLIGAIVTPTDPIVSVAILSGEVSEENLPDRLRNLLLTESGANDGIALPFVVLPVLWLTRPPEEALLHWGTVVLLWEVGGAIALGALVGYVAGKLLHWAEANKTIEKASFLAYSIALALGTLGLAELVGMNGILAVFICGLSFDRIVSGRERAEEGGVLEAVDRFFTLPIFLLIGLVLPWNDWLELGWAGLVLVVALLLLRRLPVIVALRPLTPRLHRLPDSLFLGWFGPIGIAALYYANFSVEQTGITEVWVVVSLVIFASIVVHGLTATPFTNLYGRHAKNSLRVKK